MVEHGLVRKIEKEVVEVSCANNESCESCSSSFCKTEMRVFSALNKRNLTIKPGDEVSIYLPPGKTIGAGFLVLIFPLVLFILAFTVSAKIDADLSEGIQALFGIAGLIAGFVISYFYAKNTRESIYPEIVGIRRQKTNAESGKNLPAL